eukprot:11904259-Alexandrium_andersonii.AAC.1
MGPVAMSWVVRWWTSCGPSPAQAAPSLDFPKLSATSGAGTPHPAASTTVLLALAQPPTRSR